MNSAMLDATIAMTDVVANFWSLGVRPEPGKGLEVICEGFRCSDGYVVMQVVREHQFTITRVFDAPRDLVGAAYRIRRLRPQSRRLVARHRLVRGLQHLVGLADARRRTNENP